MEIIHAVILAIIEGITEFLPISSTGHMVIGSALMGIGSNHFVKMFTVAIQFGAILSVIVLYFKRFFQMLELYYKLFLAFLPAAAIGFLFNDAIDSLLESPLTVGVTLLLGGLVLLFVDQWFKDAEGKIDPTKPTYRSAVVIGFFQVISLIPGVSRSAATIIGGLQQQLSRKQAAEFSFLLAVPTMFVATVYKMYKYQEEIGFESSDLTVLLVGNVVAFVVALIAIKGFISYLTKHGFRIFGWYRILVGIAIIALYASGVSLEVL